jgi:tetratricopeptide (TPR) repeat protein
MNGLSFPRFFKKKQKLSLNIEKCIQRIREHPLDLSLHVKLANIYKQLYQWIPAIAEYRTCIAMGGPNQSILLDLADSYMAIGYREEAISIYEDVLAEIEDGTLSERINDQISRAKSVEPKPLSNLNHNVFYRLKTLADHLIALFPSSKFSVLDVGGGTGQLALFVPKADYMLAEPSINGLSGTALPFMEKSIDVIVACHVLEHIPKNDREKFLDDVCSKSRKYVIILNPFHEPNGFEEERLKVIVELTDAQWAKEHLTCTLPSIEEIEQFALKRKYNYKVLPNGSLPTSLAMVFVEHYAALAGRNQELKKINKLYNCSFFERLTNPQFPTARLIEIEIAN